MSERRLLLGLLAGALILGYTILGLAFPRLGVAIGLGLVAASALASWRLGWLAEDRALAEERRHSVDLLPLDPYDGYEKVASTPEQVLEPARDEQAQVAEHPPPLVLGRPVDDQHPV